MSALEIEDLRSSTRRLRLAVVTETYPPEVNGVSLTAACFVQGLLARNHEIQLIRPRQANPGNAAGSEGLSEILMRGMPIPRYPELRMGLPAKRHLVRLWTHQRPDMIHIVTEGPLGWSALQAAQRLRLPVTSDFRTNFHAYSRHYGVGWLSKPIFLYLRKFHNRTQRTLVPTSEMQAQLLEAGFQNVSVVARGVDVRRFSPAHRDESLRASWGARPDDLVVLSVGRLAPEKNLSMTLAAYQAMKAANANIRLVMVGDGPSRDEVRTRCPEAVMAGMRTGDDLARHYASADVFLFPSLTETYGNVTPEAMASGLSVVAYNRAAAAQLITHGHNGLLADPGLSSSFTDLAASLVRDPVQVRMMGGNACKTASAHSWDVVVGHLEQVFHAVLREHHKQSPLNTATSLPHPRSS
jgi:glycosyltransferase involved in cell wall biosynthesis